MGGYFGVESTILPPGSLRDWELHERLRGSDVLHRFLERGGYHSLDDKKF
jgi:hypothetical protein